MNCPSPRRINWFILIIPACMVLTLAGYFLAFVTKFGWVG